VENAANLKTMNRRERDDDMTNGERDDEPEYTCDNCGYTCTLSEETFDYPGTHCTHGKGGTHRTGIYVSDCCLAGYE